MTLTITSVILFAMVLGCFAQHICPADTVRRFFTARYPFPQSGGKRVELNFHNASSAQTGWPHINSAINVSYILSFQLPNILVLEYKSNSTLSLLIHHQKLDKYFQVQPPTGIGRTFMYDAVFEAHNILYYCGIIRTTSKKFIKINININLASGYHLYPYIRTCCFKFNTDNETWDKNPGMELKNNRYEQFVVTISGQPCMFSPNVTTECLNTTSMTWYENSTLPVQVKDLSYGAERGIVHNDVLYICGLYIHRLSPYDKRHCSRYALESDGFKRMKMTLFPGIGMFRFFQLFVHDGKVYAAGVEHTRYRSIKNAVMFEVDNPGNRIEIEGPFEHAMFMSTCDTIDKM